MGKNVTRLFEQFQPENYQLELVPDRDKMVFSGKVTIRGRKVGRPAQRITLHQKDLKITAAAIVKHDRKGDHELEVTRINNHATLDEVRLHAAEMVYPGEYTLTLEFEGTITRPMHGIYPCYFKHGGQDKQLVATQFESHHAREAFPCVDEPEAKATFDLALTTPAGETVIANTPAKHHKQFASKDGGLTASTAKAGTTTPLYQTTVFETTPRMSAYLLAFVYGELGYTEGKTKDGVVVRSYATPDNVALTGFSVEVAARTLEFFEEYFGVPYPLPKLDMVALPDFAVGAMENWGLMTFRETTLLTDPKTSGIESKQLVALVIAHEVSHQWFGDLVTMKWWDDLWLNESFANLMEYRAVDELYPEWNIWEQFVAHETGSAKRRDSLADVQPIHCEVRHPDEISTLFDPSIVYAKGGSVLHMLLRYLGEDDFRAGLKLYFEKHGYGNTQAADLWEALSTASGRDIDAFMDGWVQRPGFPLVSVDWLPGSKELKLEQHRFLNDPSAKPPASDPWRVPLATTWKLSDPLLTKLTGVRSIEQSDPDQPLLFNHDGSSYFVPHYTQPDHLQQVIGGIQQGKVDTIDRLLLLDNYTILQRGGVSSTTELLDLLQAYTEEDSESVLGAMAVAVAEARRLTEGDEASEQQLDRLVTQLVLPLTKQLGWDDQPDDSAHTLRLRGLAYSLAAGAKTDPVLIEGTKRFAAFHKPADLPSSTRSVVYYVGSRYGTAADFQKLLKTYRAVQNADEREELAAGLAATKDPKHHALLFEMMTGDDVRRQDLMHWFAWLSRNRYSRDGAWQWLVGQWDWIEREFASEKSYGYFARLAASVFSRPAELQQFRDFFEPKKPVIALNRDITLGEAEIASRIAWRKRNETAVKQWLQDKASK